MSKLEALLCVCCGVGIVAIIFALPQIVALSVVCAAGG